MLVQKVANTNYRLLLALGNPLWDVQNCQFQRPEAGISNWTGQVFEFPGIWRADRKRREMCPLKHSRALWALAASKDYCRPESSRVMLLPR